MGISFYTRASCRTYQFREEFAAAVADAMALIERIKLLQEELAAQVNEQTNRTLYVLTLVTVLALPINLVAGLFGMNVGDVHAINCHELRTPGLFGAT